MDRFKRKDTERNEIRHTVVCPAGYKSSNIYCDKEGNELFVAFKYETVLLWDQLGNLDLDAIAEFNAIITVVLIPSI